MQLEQARIMTNLTRLGTEVARAGEPLKEVPILIAQIGAGTRQRALTGLQEAQARLTELETSIGTASELVGVRRPRRGVGASHEGTTSPSLLVSRTGPEGTRTFEAQATTPLQPGDVLRVNGLPDLKLSDASSVRPPTPESRRQ